MAYGREAPAGTGRHGLKRESPDEVRVVRAFENEINFGEEIVMSNHSTATPSVILFTFGRKEVRTMIIDDQPWFVAGDIATALEYRVAGDMARNLDSDEKGTQIVRTPGGDQEMLVINESGLYSAILRSRKAEAKRFKKWVTAEVLPAIRKHGRFSDEQGDMQSMMAELGLTQLNIIRGLIRDKGKIVPADKRQGFALAMHNRLHTRFNVSRTELIPACQFEAACNFIASYALEGEFIGREEGLPIKRDILSRYLLSFNEHGEQRITPVPHDACVLSHRDLIAGMVTPGEIPVSTGDMFDFAIASIRNLKARTEFLARRASV